MMTLEADSVNVQALDMGHIVVDIDGVNITELINKAAVAVLTISIDLTKNEFQIHGLGRNRKI